MPSLALGVVDQSPVASGSTPAEAIRQTIALATLTDRLGYSRYWLAEHHNAGGLASPAPEILIGEVASRTHRIRVGSGGVMLTHYSPLKVAETFRMLETLHPGRIDLGVGRAPGSDTRTARALAQGPGAVPLEQYPDQLLDLYGYLAGDLPPEHPFAGIRAMPEGPTLPELWVLGSSAASGMYAAKLGWSFSFAHFINSDGGPRVMAAYRERFEPSPFLPQPRGNVGVSVLCAESEEEAEHLSWSRWGWRIMAMARGQRGGIPSPEEAKAFAYTEPELDHIAYMRSQSIYGTPGHVRDRLEALAAEYAVEELLLVTITHDFAARCRSYELLAREFGLSATAAGGE